MHLSPLSTLATMLAQAGNNGQTVSNNVPSVAYWLAIILVAAGLGLIVIVALAWLRGRDHSGESISATEQQLLETYAPANSTAALGAIPAETPISNPMNEPAPAGTTQEAERLLRLMGEAEELCTRLARDLDERSDRLERLLARANGMIGSNLAEQRMPAPQPSYPQPQPMPGFAAPMQPQPAQQPRPEIITRPVGVPAMAATPVQAYAPAPAPMAPAMAPQPSAGHGTIPAPAPRMPAPPPIPAPQPHFAPQQHVIHPQSAAPTPSQHSANNGAASMYGQAYPAEAEALAQQIFRLADAGLTPAEIAQRLGQHTGKVELIIALRNA